MTMNARIEAELALLRLHYTRVDYVAANTMHWFRIEMLKTPEKWAPVEIPVVFAVTEAHPGRAALRLFCAAGTEHGGQAALRA